MNKFSRLFFVVLSLVTFCSNAQQLAGGEISYKCVSVDNYLVTVSLYGKCASSGTTLKQSVALSIYSPSENAQKISAVLLQTGTDQAIPACVGQKDKCSGGTGETADAIVKRTYSGTISLPRKRNDWTIELVQGPRVAMNALSGEELMLLRATVNNLNVSCNNSPSFNSAPPLFSAANQAVVYDPAVSDLDGDRLTFALIKPLIGNSSVTYNSPYSAIQPIKTTGPFGFDVNTGKMSYTPSSQGDMSATTMQVTERRNNIVVGSVMREMYFQTLTAQVSPPKFDGPDTLKFCADGTGRINVAYSGSSANPNAKLNIIWKNQAQWGGTANIISGSGTASFQLTATVTNALPKSLVLTLVDDNCGSVSKEVFVKINPRPIISFNSKRLDTTVTCIDSKKPIVLRADVRLGKPPYKYAWTNNPSTTNTISIVSAGADTITVTDANGCKNQNSWQVLSPINFVFDKYCADLTTVFYDVSADPDKINPLKRSFPLGSTKSWKWTFKDGNKELGTSNTLVGTFKFPKEGNYTVMLETSDGNATCFSRIEKQVYICGKPKIAYRLLDSCVVTERSALKIFDLIQDLSPAGSCPVLDADIRYYLNDRFVTSAFFNRYPTKINVADSGQYKLKIVAKNEAGCVDSLQKVIPIRPKPIIKKTTDDFYYRCDKNFPDTTLGFSVKTVLANTLPISATITRTDYPDSVFNMKSGSLVNVKFKIPENINSSIQFLTRETLYGCTNDTVVNISDPITPSIALKKYYCFLNDTLKLEDETYTSNGYEWGLKSARWDMKDGSVDTTLGFVNHAYSLKSLDSAIVRLIVKDITGCADTLDSQTIYLSEPDSSEFKIKEPLACFADTVKIFGIKNKFINSWFFRFKDAPELVYETPNKMVVNGAFGQSIPSNLDEIQFYESNKYTASTAIFYNEPDTSKNFVKQFVGSTENMRPLVPTEVCHLSVARDWKVVDRLHFNISTDYNHCFDFTAKVFDATVDTSFKAPNAKLDTASLTWVLRSPSLVELDKTTQSNNGTLKYNPNTTLFSDTATTRDYVIAQNKYLPYNLNISYTYQSDNLTCKDTASLKVANEKVVARIDTAPPVSCLNYTRGYYFKNPLFLSDNYQGVDEWALSEWNFGDGTKEISSLPRRRYSKPGVYSVSVKTTNYYGCVARDTFLLTILPSPVANFTVDPVCYGKESVLDASSSTPSLPTSKISKYYWFFSDTIYYHPAEAVIQNDSTEPNFDLVTLTKDTNVITQLFNVSQKVGLVVRDENGCYASYGMKTAVVNPLPVTTFTAKTLENNDEDYLGNEPIKFDATTQNVTTWTWNMGDGRIFDLGANKDATISGDTIYTYPYYAPPYPIEKNIYDVTLKVRTDGGCIDSVTKRIDVNVYFVLPSAFSPNDDGLHDKLIGVGKGIKEMKEFKIFNRWGEVVHTVTGKPEKDDAQRGYLLWDGKYKGEPQPVGAYVYYAVVKTGYGEELVFKGNLALLK